MGETPGNQPADAPQNHNAGDDHDNGIVGNGELHDAAVEIILGHRHRIHVVLQPSEAERAAARSDDRAMSSSTTPGHHRSADQAAVERLLDANLDRAREGLRVVEDWCRFGRRRPDLVMRLKDFRQRLGQAHADRFKRARHSATDPAAGMAHPAQGERPAPQQVVAANCGRVQEALRVIEEFSRQDHPALAVDAARIRYAFYDLEARLLADGTRLQRLHAARLYLVTSPVKQLEAVVAAALAAGVRLLQYRDKDCEDVLRLRRAMALRDRCAEAGALFIVNDRVDLALAIEADGVHLGQGDMPPAQARSLLGPDRLIGCSTHCMEQLRQAVADGCDYVGVGPIHATPTKPGRSAVGLSYLREAAAWSPIPYYAIGGIDHSNAAAVLAAGAHGIAVVRAVMEAEDPASSCRDLLANGVDHPSPLLQRLGRTGVSASTATAMPSATAVEGGEP